ncbi:hypothetical protein NEF87_001049 [Candidatus Lokiarchaeum ossiferum]|uniref:Resolvase/invertase-type recombinase catalytic domain-containing protein n=1 Tax=Candidatus Lokiarchaeum ossiferum TaxID=2951803 RepID=A0ABY6HQB5_9ARCH|nr:hypothetical protein NEF87_001049 [Candidatus Lokiarchaeum sp. B-35]
MKVFAYYRISPNPRKNTPENNQINEIESYSLQKNIEIVKEYKDLLVSGKIINQKGFNEMLSNLSKVDGNIIYDVSRFGRNAKEAIPLFINILSMKKAIKFVKDNKTLDYSDSSDMSIWEMLVPIIELFQAEEYIKNLHIM